MACDTDEAQMLARQIKEERQLRSQPCLTK